MGKLEDLFNRAQKAELEQAENASKRKTSLKNDPRLIHFKAGNTYRFRLLFAEGKERVKPLVHKYTHNYFVKGADKVGYVVCPTSEYISHKFGFNECPVCQQLNNWWEEGKTSPSSKELYSTFRRQFNGFVPVFVINDPTNEDNNGTVKIMRYGVNIRKYLKAKIHGINDKDDSVIEGADTIGIEAFKLKQGRDLLITVTEKQVEENGQKKVYPEYACEFATKLTDITLTEKQVNKESEFLGFDTDFYETSTPEEVQNFCKDFVLREDVESAVPASNDEVVPKPKEKELEDDIPYDNETLEPTEPKEEAGDDLGDDEIDDLLKDLEDI